MNLLFCLSPTGNFFTEIHNKAKRDVISMALVCGIDEAGRGPILGPLVIAAAVMDESGLDRLRNMGVKDSKLLTPLQRERISEELRTVLHSFKIIELAPAQI